MAKIRNILLSPKKPSENLPLLGEGLLLYDKVTLDASGYAFFELLSKNINLTTMEKLLDENILNFTYNLQAPMISTQNKKYINTILWLDYLKSGIDILDFDKAKNHLKTVYTTDIINEIEKKILPTKVDVNVLIENCALDFTNEPYCQSVFDYVKDEFQLSEFEVHTQYGGCVIIPRTNNKNKAKKIIDEASYALHLIAEVNYKMALTTQFDEVICESEFEQFLARKLNLNFKNQLHNKYSENLIELCVINDFPDIKELVSSGLFQIEDILKLRKSHGGMLRNWLQNATQRSISTDTSFSHYYAKAISSLRSGLPVPMRTVVFGLLQTMSYMKPPLNYASTMLSVVNDYLVPKVVDKWQPKLFFDKARKLEAKKRKLS